ncbi:muraminidase [Pantoea rodasii]|uniref:Lysozyme n=1 Tax=Pantoea rodasii TaxID=1076549 RepID=A0A2M9W5W9_9GAMM|nr:lysozyme [Pantoea rodasii]ORM61631.1 muraminidase [Pantoea rodasii]PJZ02899.1 muraminidase [Pantoea rodasii]
MQISNTGLNLIKAFEGCSLTAYRDSAGVWTIGYGWTQAVNGVPIHAGMTITQGRAEALLRVGLEQYEAPVNASVTVGLTQCQFDALVSLTYNLGAGSFEKSTLLKKLNAGDIQGAADQFLTWYKAGGQTLPGLVRRRAYERDLFLGYSS